mgnify:CR=1 FL=1
MSKQIITDYVNGKFDPFEVFGIPRGTMISEEELKQIYYKLAKKYHPDKSPKNNGIFQLIVKSHYILKILLKTAQESNDFTPTNRKSNEELFSYIQESSISPGDLNDVNIRKRMLMENTDLPTENEFRNELQLHKIGQTIKQDYKAFDNRVFKKGSLDRNEFNSVFDNMKRRIDSPVSQSQVIQYDPDAVQGVSNIKSKAKLGRVITDPRTKMLMHNMNNDTRKDLGFDLDNADITNTEKIQETPLNVHKQLGKARQERKTAFSPNEMEDEETFSRRKQINDINDAVENMEFFSQYKHVFPDRLLK